LGAIRSEWLNLKTGVPQGSLMDPLLFNIFTNDIIFKEQLICDIYNCADDNTLSFIHIDLKTMKYTLEIASEQAIRWFSSNFMKANPSQFQAICISRDHSLIDFKINNHKISAENTVKIPLMTN
jgi:hypothetical protein